MAAHLVICGEADVHGRGCGAAFVSSQPHAKLCHTCRALAEAKFMVTRATRGRVRDCKACGRPFARLKAGDMLCADCDDVRMWRPGTCQLCGAASQHLLHDDLHICLACAKDPAEGAQLRYFQALTAQRSRRREDPARAAQLDAWRIACVAASRVGDDLPAKPEAPAPELVAFEWPAWLDPHNAQDVADQFEDWEVDVIRAADERWGELRIEPDELGDRDYLYHSLAEAVALEARPEVRAWFEAHAELRSGALAEHPA